MNVTMDRYEADWGIVERGWAAHVRGEARTFRSAREAVLAFRSEDPSLGDQFLPAFAIVDDGGTPVGPIRDGDSVVLINFRGDRAIEISRAFDEADFRPFDRGRVPDVAFAGMMEYDGDTHVPKNFLVAPPAIDRTLGEYLVRTARRSSRSARPRSSATSPTSGTATAAAPSTRSWSATWRFPATRCPSKNDPG